MGWSFCNGIIVALPLLQSISMQRLPKIRYKTFQRVAERDLSKFASDVERSIKYHIKAYLRKQGLQVFDSKKFGTDRTSIANFIKKLEAMWADRIDEFADVLINKAIRRLKKVIQRTYSGIEKDFNFNSAEFKEIIAICKERYYDLIVSIPKDLLEEIKQKMYEAIIKGDAYEVSKVLQAQGSRAKQGDNLAWRANFIARDQTAKMAEAINRTALENLNIQYYEWLTMKDERVSKNEKGRIGGHKHLEGRIYRLDEPTAIINYDGTKGHPAERPNCRCTAVGVYLEAGERLELVRDSRYGDYYKIVKGV